MTLKMVNPPGWPQPKGYSNAMTGRGRLVFVAGQVGWTADMRWEASDFAGQFRQALENTVAVLGAAGAQPTDIARMTIFVTSKGAYMSALPEIGRAWREQIGKHFPAMTLVEVGALVEDKAMVEIETTAVVPDDREGEQG
jgi:enamine deaminase RidA (YjgF/YER057c/UK114 family)